MNEKQAKINGIIKIQGIIAIALFTIAIITLICAICLPINTINNQKSENDLILSSSNITSEEQLAELEESLDDLLKDVKNRELILLVVLIALSLVVGVVGYLLTLNNKSLKIINDIEEKTEEELIAENLNK